MQFHLERNIFILFSIFPLRIMPLNWWHSIMALPIQNRLIGIQPLRDEASLHQAIKNGSAGLLSFSFLDIYLPSQPNLLFALLLLLIATIFSLLILFAVLVRCRLSKGGFFTTNGQETDEKFSHRHSRFRLLLSISIPLWLLLLFGSILFASTLVELISVQSGQDGPIAINEALVMEEDAEMMETGPMGRETRDNVGAAGQKMLQKFEAIRELGYQFHSLLSPALFSGWMAFLLIFLLFIFLCTSILSLLAILIGLNQRFRRYSPMVEHFSSKQITSRSQRIRRLLIGTGICLLIAGPAMIGLGSILLIHSHAHSAICVIEQRMNQDGAILEHVQANFATEEDSLALPEFLADLAQERLAVNEENCQKERAPLESLWSATLFLALISIPFGLCLLLISAGWDCPEREGSVSLRAYVPGWLQNSALTPDAYSSIPEMNGLNTAQRNHSASQCSFGTGTGTFVYKKY